MDVDCSHPVRLHGLCAYCGKDVLEDGDETASSTQRHILHSSLGLTVAAAEAERIERQLQDRLLAAGKLSLVVDLDQTVLHATIDPHVARIVEGRDDIFRITLPEMPAQLYYIKLRPHLQAFLQRMSELFELHVYTMGSRSYAAAVVRLFDPEGRLFYDRLLSRDDAGIGLEHRKNLKRIFPADDSTVLVIDDRVDVWDYSRSLIPVPPYTFFVGIGDINRGRPPTGFISSEGAATAGDETSPPGVEGHADAVVADDSDQELLRIQSILEAVHAEFFEMYRTAGGRLPDVKEIVDAKRRAVLAGVAIVFSGIIPLGLPPDSFELWRLAEMFGASCGTAIRSNTTHVISFRSDTDKVLQAVEAGIPVVRPDWLLACFRQWRRVATDGFAVEGIQQGRRAAIDDSAVEGIRQWKRVAIDDPAVEGLQPHPSSDHEQLSLGDDVEFDPAELQAMNDELAELEQSYDSDSDEDAEPSSKRRKSDISQSTDAQSADADNLFVEELERSLL